MKWVDILYYIFISLITVFLLLMCIAYPAAFIAVIPICIFLFLAPHLKSSKNVEDYTQKTEKERYDYYSYINERESCDNSMMKERAQFKAERNRLERQLQDAINNQAITQKKLDSANSALNENKKLLSQLVPTMDGKIYERYVGSRLLADGYKELIYTPVTGDFGADIIARNPYGKKVCIQCKRYAEMVGIDAVQEIVAAKQYYNCDVAIVITNSTFTPAAKELAIKTGVGLIEGYM